MSEETRLFLILLRSCGTNSNENPRPDNRLRYGHGSPLRTHGRRFIPWNLPARGGRRAKVHTGNIQRVGGAIQGAKPQEASAQVRRVSRTHHAAKLPKEDQGEGMTEKEYCSTVCEAKCCKAHGPLVWPKACPALTKDNLCSVYDQRFSVKFEGLTTEGRKIVCGCTKPETFIPNLPPEVREQCCYHNPELLKKV
ncbi:MAG: hypothetical protein JWM68_3756 [Verrucomicrobiales bacterium]|nr:hypothetical protein [Verrucomicrobiales bacterium]